MVANPLNIIEYPFDSFPCQQVVPSPTKLSTVSAEDGEGWLEDHDENMDGTSKDCIRTIIGEVLATEGHHRKDSESLFMNC